MQPAVTQAAFPFMAVFNIFLQGFITGLVVALSFGAGFFALVQTSINSGIRKGLLIALGSIISDMLFISLSLFATSFISTELPKYGGIIKIIALLTFLVMGVRSILKSGKFIESSDKGNMSVTYYISKGFLLNTINPMILITWIGISVYLESSMMYTLNNLLIFFVAVVIAVALAQFGVCYSSSRIRRYLSEKFIHRVNIFTGIFFIVMGLIIFLSNSSTSQGIEKAKMLLDR